MKNEVKIHEADPSLNSIRIPKEVPECLQPRKQYTMAKALLCRRVIILPVYLGQLQDQKLMMSHLQHNRLSILSIYLLYSKKYFKKKEPTSRNCEGGFFYSFK